MNRLFSVSEGNEFKLKFQLINHDFELNSSFEFVLILEICAEIESFKPKHFFPFNEWIQ
jgi:hypothetical protein